MRITEKNNFKVPLLLCFFTILMKMNFAWGQSKYEVYGFLLLESNVSSIRSNGDTLLLSKPVYFSAAKIDSLTFIPDLEVLKGLGYSERFSDNSFRHYKVYKRDPSTFYTHAYISSNIYGKVLKPKKIEPRAFNFPNCDNSSFLSSTNKYARLLYTVEYNKKSFQIIYVEKGVMGKPSLIIKEKNECDQSSYIESETNIDLDSFEVFENISGNQIIVKNGNSYFCISFGTKF